jgi:hypothetical protein
MPLGALAHTLTVPPAVQAHDDGSFHYKCVFTAGPGSVLIGSFGEPGGSEAAVTDPAHEVAAGPAGGVVVAWCRGRDSNPDGVSPRGF